MGEGENAAVGLNTNHALEALIADLMDRDNDVRDWPEDERQLHRREGWRSHGERNQAVLALRAHKALLLVANTLAAERQQVAYGDPFEQAYGESFNEGVGCCLKAIGFVKHKDEF